MARQTVDPAWQRLAELLVKRRINLDARYRNRRVFCEDKEIDYRVISDLEGARRDNFSRTMVTAIEVAYEIAEGAIHAFLKDPTITDLPRRVSARATLGPVRANVEIPRPTVEMPEGVDPSSIPRWEWELWNVDLPLKHRRALIHFGRLLRGDLRNAPAELLELKETIDVAIDDFLRSRQDPPRAV